MFRFTYFLTILFLCAACVNTNPKEFDGRYKGSDGAKNDPQEINLVMGVTGDGFINGSWKSNGEVKEGQFSGKIGVFSSSMSLNSLSGSCLGEFKGTFKLKENHFQGTLGGNPRCPENTFAFEAAKE